MRTTRRISRSACNDRFLLEDTVDPAPERLGGSCYVGHGLVGLGRLGHVGGVRLVQPLGEFQTHERMRYFFTPDGWEYCFRRLPAVFRSYPALKGVFGGSWFFDPQAAEITPSLSFVRDVSERWGSMIMRDRVDPATTAGALEMSGLRRNLHAEGRYQPVNHLMVAAKSCILDRARESIL